MDTLLMLIVAIVAGLVSYYVWAAFLKSTGKEGKGMFALNTHIDSKEHRVQTDAYADMFDKDEASSKRKANYLEMVNDYYDFSTDFFEWGWGECFHFAPRHARETKDSSLARHEHRVAHAIGLKAGQKALDIGCGIGGPMREIARFTGARITGVNINAYQIQRGKLLNARSGLDKLCDFVNADFMALPFPDNSYDGAFAIEATCHAPDRVGVFSEVFRALKPGGMFAGYDWLMTDKYDAENKTHREIKHNIEIGDGLPDIVGIPKFQEALRRSGFEVLFMEDVAPVDKVFDVSWYSEFVPTWSLKGLKLTWLGINLTHFIVWLLEKLHFAPGGITKAHGMLMEAADGLRRGGQTGIFTPCYMFVARKPSVPAL